MRFVQNSARLDWVDGRKRHDCEIVTTQMTWSWCLGLEYGRQDEIDTLESGTSKLEIL